MELNGLAPYFDSLR